MLHYIKFNWAGTAAGLCVICTFIFTALAQAQSSVKPPNVAGQFYSADAKELSIHINALTTEAQTAPYTHPVDVLIAPHAGYVYSGKTAAAGYHSVKDIPYETIIILAPSHFYGFDGISIWSSGAFQTPLGKVEVDEEFAIRLSNMDERFVFDPNAFAREHSLEVQIPFIQKTFKEAKIVPVVMGQPDFDTIVRFAQGLDALIAKRDDVLIVVSTDFSHYHDDELARATDAKTIEAIRTLDVEALINGYQNKQMEMCGFIPVVTALVYAKLRGLDQVDVLEYTNSGDSTGDYSRVVGYAAATMYRQQTPTTTSPLTDAQKKRLIDIAKEAVNEYVMNGTVIEINESDVRLKEEEGVFVSLYRDGKLCGCIGNIIGRGPLCVLTRDMAIASATEDARFRPVDKSELKGIKVEVSVLSKPRVINDVSEIELGTHGVILRRGLNGGVFLPQVADSTGWSKEEFLNELCSQKAGLPVNCWRDPATRIEVFTAEVFSENEKVPGTFLGDR